MANRSLRPGLIRESGAREWRWNGRRVVAEGLKQKPWTDLYHSAMLASWPQLLGALAAIFVILNSVFAALYLLGEAPVANAHPGSFADMFFFSVETISTTGYGDMHPQTLYGHLVASAEDFVGLLATAAMTGLVFARFARPSAHLIFARNPVVFEHDGVATFAVRVVNARNSFISEATAKLWMLAPSISAEGRRFVGFQPMRLSKAENPAFALSWTLFHPIDETSPLFGLKEIDALENDANFVISISGVDETSSQVVHDRHTYVAEDLRWNCEFIDMFSTDADGVRHVDISKVHETKPNVRNLKDA